MFDKDNKVNLKVKLQFFVCEVLLADIQRDKLVKSIEELDFTSAVEIGLQSHQKLLRVCVASM